MSRLYLKATSDTRDTVLTKTGTQELTASVYWGSRSSSQLAGRIYVQWPKDAKEPTVFFASGDNIEVKKALG